jgi:hypothetical protein
MADITFVNLNMLFVRYTDAYDKEIYSAPTHDPRAPYGLRRPAIA